MADSTTSAEATPAAATPVTPRATSNRSTTPVSAEFARYISADWAERPDATPSARPQASFAASRRARISVLHEGARLIIPAGATKTRSNDTDYPYRAHSAFAYLTGWGSDTVAGSVLVLEPTATGHEPTLYFRQSAGRDTDEFYANSEIGEFWSGARPTLAQVAADLGLSTAPLESLADALDAPVASTVSIDDESGAETNGAELLRQLSEMRLVKDEFELSELRSAVDATKFGFDDVIADLPEIAASARGERLVEGTFNRRARLEGNTVGYDTIAASGPHACILHWTRNDGPVMPGDLILIDADDVVGTYGIGEPGGDDAQQLVARVVAQAVVDQLETVEVDVEQTELGPLTLGPAERTREAVVEVAAIAETGQLVDARAGLGLGEALHVVCGVLADPENP